MQPLHLFGCTYCLSMLDAAKSLNFLGKEIEPVTKIFSPIGRYTAAVRRYAGALFAVAQDANCVEQVGEILLELKQKIEQDRDLQLFFKSPVFSRKEQMRFLESWIKEIGLDGPELVGSELARSRAAGLVGNFLKKCAQAGRLSSIREMISAFYAKSSEFRGEIEAKIVSAQDLDEAKRLELQRVFSEISGKNVRMQVEIDPALLSGFIVQLGSYQIDGSLRCRLSSLKHVLNKEVN